MGNVLKGLIISILLLVLVIIFLYIEGIQNPSELGYLLFLLPVFPISGILLGHTASKIQTKRFLKLFILSLALVYSSALILAGIMVFLDDSKMIQGMDILFSILMLATVGFFIYGIFIFPILMAGIFVLERWTRIEQ